MIDITNKTNEEINEIIQKYGSVLETIKHKNQIPIIAYIIDIGIKYIQERHINLKPEWKAWCFVVLKNLHTKLNNESDIIKTIDEFIEYSINNYDNYLSTIDSYTEEFYRDWSFVYTFLKTR